MVAGYEVTKMDLDRRMGSSVIALRDAFVAIEKVQEYLGRCGDEGLVEKGYTTEEIMLIKSAFNDLVVLKAVAEGGVSQPTATDFFAWGNHLTGLE